MSPLAAAAQHVSLARKAIASFLLGLVTWGTTAQTNGIDGAEWWGLASVAVGSFIIWLIPSSST